MFRCICFHAGVLTHRNLILSGLQKLCWTVCWRNTYIKLLVTNGDGQGKRKEEDLRKWKSVQKNNISGEKPELSWWLSVLCWRVLRHSHLKYTHMHQLPIVLSGIIIAKFRRKRQETIQVGPTMSHICKTTPAHSVGCSELGDIQQNTTSLAEQVNPFPFMGRHADIIMITGRGPIWLSHSWMSSWPRFTPRRTIHNSHEKSRYTVVNSSRSTVRLCGKSPDGFQSV